jgi:chloramphenicol-sensitive protein RarD
MSPEPSPNRLRLGFFCAIGAQVIWGVFPLYYYLLKSIDSFQLVCHRAIWAFSILIVILLLRWLIPSANKKSLQELSRVLVDKKTLALVVLAAILIGINWTVFVWAVTNGLTLDASLGYYICPQVNVLLGVLVLRERLQALQWLAVGLAACGVVYIASFSDHVPWAALAVASSFGLYGLVKKKVRLTATAGLTLETGVLLVPAIAYLSYCSMVLGDNLIPSSGKLGVLLIFSGAMTVLPLTFYAIALKHIPLSTVGLLQFVGPTLQFFSGAILLGEPFDHNRLIGFIFVWLGLGLYLLSMHQQTGTLPKTN